MKKLLLITLLVGFMLSAFIGVSYYRQIHSVSISDKESITFVVKQGDSVFETTKKLQEDGVIKSASLLRKYLSFKKLDTKIHAGTFTVTAPITIERVANAFDQPTYQEITLTFLPGWNLRDIGDYLNKKQGISKKEFESLVGVTAKQKTNRASYDYKMLDGLNKNLSLEGYLAPDTFRFFVDVTPKEIVQKLLSQRQNQITDEMHKEIKSQGKTLHQIMTMASVIEREVRDTDDRKKVSDLFWRRIEAGWGLQADSTVHYLTAKTGDVFTTSKDRDTDSPWNTYKYRGLPPGPISMPSLDSIMAAIYPTPNEEWYFLTTFKGVVKYGKTLDEHNANVQKYLR